MSVLTFDYRAIDRTGKHVRGHATASSENEAFRKLSQQGLTPTRLRQVIAGQSRRGIKTKDICAFTSQLGVLVSARVPIGEGLLSIAEQENNPRMREVITDIAARIDAGEQIAASMEHHRAVFGDMYIQTIHAAEKTGNLPKVLDHLSSMLERAEETRRQVKSSLMYPMCVIVVLAIAVTFLLGFVVPKFARMFKARGVELPTITQSMMVIGDSMQQFWWAYLIVIGGSFFGVRSMLKRESGRAFFDDVLHRIPVIKGVLQSLAMSRFAHVMGLSISAGLGLIDSLELAGRASDRPKLMRDIDGVVANVRTGSRLNDALKPCPYVTSFTKRMISAGETSGELPRMCGIIANYYDKQTGHIAKSISTLVEPLLVVAIATVVLLVALAIFLPMWNMVNIMS